MSGPGNQIVCPCGRLVTLTKTNAIPWHLVGELTPCDEVGRCDPAIRLVSAEERAERRQAMHKRL